MLSVTLYSTVGGRGGVQSTHAPYPKTNSASRHPCPTTILRLHPHTHLRRRLLLCCRFPHLSQCWSRVAVASWFLETHRKLDDFASDVTLDLGSSLSSLDMSAHRPMEQSVSDGSNRGSSCFFAAILVRRSLLPNVGFQALNSLTSVIDTGNQPTA